MQCQGCKHNILNAYVDYPINQDRPCPNDVLIYCKFLPKLIRFRITDCSKFEPIVPIGSKVRDNNKIYEVIHFCRDGTLVLRNIQSKRKRGIKRVRPELIPYLEVIKEPEKKE